ESVTHRLRGGRRRRDHPYGDVPFDTHLGDVVQVRHRYSTHRHPDQVGVDVEQGRDGEPTPRKATVVRQCMSQVTDSHHGDLVLAGQPQRPLDLPDQHLDLVTDAPGAVRAEVRQVLTQLGGIHTGRGRQLLT